MPAQYSYEQKWFNRSDPSFEDSISFLNEFGKQGYELDKVVPVGQMMLYVMKKTLCLSLQLSEKEFGNGDLGKVY